MFPTVRDVLALDPVRHGAPHVLAGAAALSRPVRWVHSAEVPDIATLLRGGELVLTTGIGLPTDDAGLRRFVAELAEVPAAGLVVELGRRYPDAVPKVMVAAAEKYRLPLVELRRATPFVRITEAVHALIVEEQLAELRATEEIHQRFTELSVEGAEPSEVVAQATALSGCPVVLENLSRQVLAYDSAGDRADLLLDGWEQHSRRITVAARTGYHVRTGWLVTVVGARGQDWGRLLLRWPPSGAPGGLAAAAAAGARSGGVAGGRTAGAGSTTAAGETGAGDRAVDEPEPPTRMTILLERAASALALGRLIRRDAEGLERQVHRTVLSALLDHSRPVDEVALRAKALGVPLDRRRLVGVVVRQRGEATGTEAAGRLRDLAEAVSSALREVNLPGLTSALDDQTVGALVTMRTDSDEDVLLTAFAAALRKGRRAGLVVAAGSAADSPRDARRSIVEARQVAYAARRDTRDVPVFRLPHVGLPGLLHLLREDPRMQTFVERELGALLAYDAGHPKEQLIGALRAYLDSGRNKSAAAVTAHLSRPAFYERLARIGRILAADLDSPEDCLSLHVALLALDAIRES